MFDSIINEAQEKLGLGDKAGGVVAALLGLMADPASDGFGGFLNKFRSVGMKDEVDSWIGTGENTSISNDQVESALGAEAIDRVAGQSGVDRTMAASAIGFLTPRVVDALTPDGEVPDEAGLRSKLTGFLGGMGGAATAAVVGSIGAVGALAGGAVDKVGEAGGAGLNAGKAAAAGLGGTAAATMHKVGDVFDGGSQDGVGSALKWILPLLLLGFLIGIGWWVLRPSTPIASTTPPAANKPTAASPTAAPSVQAATSDANRKLTEVTLPNGTKLQAYPNGIEDQLIKFIQSDEYKNGTAESLKEKWFSFDDLNFKFSSTELAPESKRQLDNIVAILKAYPDVKVKVGGYTDKKGNDAANKKLSDDRAKAIKAALEKAGVAAQVPEAEGYGEEFAKVPETAGDEERQADRKTSVRLLK